MVNYVTQFGAKKPLFFSHNSNNSPQNPSSKDEETLEQYIARKLTAAGLVEKIQTTIQKCKDQDIVNVKSLQNLSYSQLRECGFTIGIANALVIQGMNIFNMLASYYLYFM